MSSTKSVEYERFLKSKTADQWKKIGTNRRAGVATPLFSLHSKQSAGIGDFRDLRSLCDWASQTGLSIIQLLPINDVGFEFRPYDAQSSFALDPMYLVLDELMDVSVEDAEAEASSLRERFPLNGVRVDYAIKRAKLESLQKLFEKKNPQHAAFIRFCESCASWLEDYALFKVIKSQRNEEGWESWPGDLKNRDAERLKTFKKENENLILFRKWLQWQSFEQFKRAREYAESKKILLMGDIPFLVSRDSADVWAHQTYFKLEAVSGAPPDVYFAKGQKWGMPAYNWQSIEAQGYDYLRTKLTYAENFFHLYRVDHVVGVFRLWTIRTDEPAENAGLNGTFDPENEGEWDAHGRKLLSVMIESTSMLPCGEDLGTIPPCTFQVLDEFAIPGMDIQRWKREWGGSKDFQDGNQYRPHSIAIISTHDTSSLLAWLRHEIGTVDKLFMRILFDRYGLNFDELQDKVFSLGGEPQDRMRWNSSVRTVDDLRSLLRKSKDEASEIFNAFESSIDEPERFAVYLGLAESAEEQDMVKRSLERINETKSVYAIQLLQDWLSLDTEWAGDVLDYRINIPGMMDDKNWSLLAPYTLEKMMKLELNRTIKVIVTESNRTGG